MAKETVTPTRFPELGIANHGRGLWRIVADNDYYNAVGPHYASKMEAMCDLERFASLYGATGSAPFNAR